MPTRRIRLAIAAVIVGAAIGLVFAARSAPAPTIELYEVGTDLDDLSRQTDTIDHFSFYLHTLKASVHLHVMGKGQTCPLHLHAANDEVVAIVRGVADVTQVFGQNGQLATRHGQYPPGSVVVSPILCGHEWYNPSVDQTLGNLVFAEPTFSGNLYLHDRADPRLLQGGVPFSVDPAARLSALMASGEPMRLEPIAAFGGDLALGLLAAPAEVPAWEGGDTLAYILDGTGTIVEGTTRRPLHPTLLAWFPPGHTARLEPEPGHPLALLLFTPGGHHPILR